MAKQPILKDWSESPHPVSMRVMAGALGLIVAMVYGFVAVGQVSLLQDVSKPITSGGTNDIFGVTTFVMLLIAVSIAVLTVGAFAAMALKR